MPDSRAVNQDEKNLVFSGTSISAGKAKDVVISTGSATTIGKLNEAIAQTEKINNFVRLIKVITLIRITAWAVNINFNDPAHSGSWLKSAVYYIKIAVALAVAAIHEDLSTIITAFLVSLQRGADQGPSGTVRTPASSLAATPSSTALASMPPASTPSC